MMWRHRRTVPLFPPYTNFDPVFCKVSEQVTAAVNDKELVFVTIGDL
jgi:hypothetical protein